MGPLAGKIAMVPGAGGEHSFGRAIAKRLAGDGADLVLTDLEPTGVKLIARTPPSGWGGHT